MRRHGSTALFVASTGGHLDELVRLRPRLLGPDADVEWVTFSTEQATTLLAGERAHYVRYLGPRDYRSAVTNLAPAVRLLSSRRYDRIVTTGAGIAVPFAAVGLAFGARCHYIESAARCAGPSLTGSVVSRIPSARLYTQSGSWAGGRWTYGGSVFDGFERLADRPARPIRRVVVTLGTMRTYGFRRAVEALAKLLPDVMEPGGDVLWQTGSTDCSGLPVDGRDTVPVGELRAAVSEADLVVAHAGIGSALMALDCGRAPLLLPRLARHGEHVDDHQVLIGAELAARGLAEPCDPYALSADVLVDVAHRVVGPAATLPAFQLAA
jgi:UDP-N-acetylglucosamine transferase subunit ALG13